MFHLRPRLVNQFTADKTVYGFSNLIPIFLHSLEQNMPNHSSHAMALRKCIMTDFTFANCHHLLSTSVSLPDSLYDGVLENDN